MGTIANLNMLTRSLPKKKAGEPLFDIPAHKPIHPKNIDGAKYSVGDRISVNNGWISEVRNVLLMGGEIWYEISYPRSKYSNVNDSFKFVKESCIEHKL